MGKRIRSLASVLWDTEDVEEPHDYFDVPSQYGQERELQLENSFLKSRVEQLSCEVDNLKKQLATQPVTQNNMVPFLESLGDTDQWVRKLKPDVVCLPRLQLEVLPDLWNKQYCKGCIVFQLPEISATASQVTKHGEEVIAKLSAKHPAVFKIGITSNPVRRWLHPTYGYARDTIERWQGMKIWAVTSNSLSVALLEHFMISKFQNLPGCRNSRPGGESAAPGAGPHFAYVVARLLVPPSRVVSHG